MAKSHPEVGHKVVAKVIDATKGCTIGMKDGEWHELSVHKCGDFCGYFYHNIFGAIYTLQFGGELPEPSGVMQRQDKPETLEFSGTYKWKDDNVQTQIWDCPNPVKKVQIELGRLPR